MNTNILLSRSGSAALQRRDYSKAYTVFLLFLGFLMISFVGCKKDDFEDEVAGVCPVVATDPTDKAVDVALNKVISATFNTSMKSESINGSTFIIKQGSNVIQGTIGTSTNGKVFTFTPTGSQPAMLPFTDYTGRITTGAIDTFRTAMVSDYEWTFKTIPQVTVASSAGGTASPTFSAAQGSNATVTATPAANFVFTGWAAKDTPAVIVSSSAGYTFRMNGNRSLVANFAAVPAGKFAVNLSSNPAAGGTNTGGGAYTADTTATVAATPNAGYTFTNWTENGTEVSTSSSYQFNITGNRTLIANYSIIPASQFAIILSSSPLAGGTTGGSGSFAANSSKTVTATANAGYTFTEWTEAGTQVSTSASYTFPLTANRNLTANFTLNTYSLTVSAVNGSVAKNPELNPGSPTSTHNHAATVQLTATPNAGYVFDSWSGDASGKANPLTVAMTSNKTITAIFTAIVPEPALFTSAFGAFGGNAGITNQGVNTVINNGSIGTTGASTKITGFHDMTGDKYIETGLNIGDVKDGRIYTDGPPPVIFGAGGPFGGNATTKAIADAALLEATAFYNSISPAQKPGGIVQNQELGGLTLPAGVYKAASGPFEIKNGDLTLDAKGDPNAVWIFQAESSLTVGLQATGGARSVKLINGALAKNVYWYVGSAAEINYNGGGTMVGTIVSTAGVTLSSPANSTNTLVQTVLNGRAISLVASVTMVNTIINVPAP